MKNNTNRENISKIKDCYGCGVCAISCPLRIIEIKQNFKGFWEPVIVDQSRCIECGLCLKNCAYYHDKISVNNIPIGSYAGWSKDKHIRYISSSGGVCYEICKYFILKGYKVCGVKYDNETNIVAHVICSSIKDLNQITGSKYLQSYTLKGFEELNSKEKFVIIGTPCQIDSIRRYIKNKKIEDNYILIDFFCHGVPSSKLWQKFSNYLNQNIGKFDSVTWRNKIDGWHKSYRLDIKAFLGEYHHTGQKFDDFFSLYFSNAALSPACFDKCKYKQEHSSADIRVGDMWGLKYEKNNDGINSILCFTDKGNNAIHEINCVIKSHSLDEVLSGQMKSVPARNVFFYKLNPLIIDNTDNWSEIIRVSRRMHFKKKVLRKIFAITKKIFRTPLKR